MKLFASIALSFCLCCCFNAKAASFEWPKTPAAKVFEAFVIAYNTGSAAKIETFVKAHYGKSGAEYVAQKTEYWLDIFYRFGPVRAHSLSINQPLDLEVWVQGTTSKAWFAPEFLLNKTTHKIRATGMMTGEQPQGTATPAPSDKAFLANLIDYLSANENSGLFHGAVLVQHHNQTVLSQAYGFKNIAQKQKNSVTTKMRLASVAKPITAVAAIQLVQKGLLDLHTPVSKYLPELPKQIGDNITIFQLLSHTSGYELDGIDGFREALQKTHSMAEVYATQLKFLPQWQHYQAFEVSNKFDYANDSYDLVAIIIEKISGLRFETYIKQHIFDVANMPNTGFSKVDVATPYRFDLSEDGLMDSESYYPQSWGHISGAAALKSTVGDLSHFFNALFNGDKLLDGAHKNLLLAPLVNNTSTEYQSLGMNISKAVVHNYGHGGVSIGGASQWRYFPESGYLLVALSNDRSGAHNLYSFFKNNLPH